MDGQLDLFSDKPKQVPASDPCANFHHGASTSVDAFRSTPETSRQAQRETIFRYILDSGSNGATCDEAEAFLKVSHQTASARITDLLEAGRIHYGTETRKTRAGKSARVYRISNSEGGIA